MIQTAAIIATTITAGMFCTLWLDARSKYRWAIEGWNRIASRCEEQSDLLYDAEIRLRLIERQRSETTRRGNLTRSAKRRAAVASTTEQIRKEIGR